MIQGRPNPDADPAAALAGAVDAAELRAFVERALATRVHALALRALPQTSFPCAVLEVRGAAWSGELFFKDFGSCRLPRASAAGPAREIALYRELLDAGALGTPRHVGSCLEDGRAWLLLEHVRAPRLAKHDAPAWRAAAAWLARLQALPVPEGRARAQLAVHDAAHLQEVAHAAVRAVAELDLRLEHELQDALEGHELEAERLADQPRVLVHGSFRPENLLVDPAASPARVAAVDWEHAALGSALYDVAFLGASLTRAQAEELLAAFAAAAHERGLALPPPAERWELVTSLRLHKALRSLGRTQAWGYTRETVVKLVALAGRLARELAELRAARRRARVGVPAAPESHPALRVARALGLATGAAPEVERLQGRYFSRKGRIVYRLGPIGPGGMPVVAKRAKLAHLAHERRVYAEILPRLELAAARALGWVEEGAAGWLFLEDVGARRLRTEEADERRLALEWVAALNRASRTLAPPAGLADRGPRGYLALLREARQALVAGRGNPALGDEGRVQLDGVCAACARVEAGWETVAAACARMPATLVHGDFRPKNVFVRAGPDGPAALPIDWEYSGWGVPAVDLGSWFRDHGEPAELEPYRAALAPLVPDLDVDELWRWVLAGRVFRAVASLHWTRNSLAYPFVEKPVRDLCAYRAALEQAFDALAAPRAGSVTR